MRITFSPASTYAICTITVNTQFNEFKWNALHSLQNYIFVILIKKNTPATYKMLYRTKICRAQFYSTTHEVQRSLLFYPHFCAFFCVTTVYPFLIFSWCPSLAFIHFQFRCFSFSIHWCITSSFYGVKFSLNHFPFALFICLFFSLSLPL